MTTFSIAAALLIALSLLFILPPLLRSERSRRGPAARAVANLAVLRDQLHELDADLVAGTIDATGYAQARGELERRVASDVGAVPAATAEQLGGPRRLAAALLTLAVPALACALYLLLGTPVALDPTRMQANEELARQTELAELVESMAAQLRKQPNDVAGWNMLARSYASMGNFEKAADTYRHLISLDPDNPNLLVDFADVLAMSRGKTMQGEPEQLVMCALRIDAENFKGLSLLGSTLFERGDYAGAVAQWKKILPLVPPDSDTARNTIESIAIAQQRQAAP
nr:c-type cytochrome biogenesis protein CcmI [uncultured Duganella sp.]